MFCFGMGRSLAIILVVVVVVMAIGGIGGRAEGVENKSASGGLFWSTAKEEGDLHHHHHHQVVVSKAKTDSDESSSAALQLNQADELDGGFSSLDGMLQWAIGTCPSHLLCFILSYYTLHTYIYTHAYIIVIIIISTNCNITFFV